MPVRGTPDAEWVPIAQSFPCSLNKDSAPELLKDGESPEAYGQGIDKPGLLYVGTAPSGTAWTGIATASAPTYAPAICTWRMIENRLWGFVTAGGTKIYYGAYGYDTNYIIQNLGYIPVDYESSNIVNAVSFGNNVAIGKSDHLYVVRNSDSPSGNFVAELVKQASGMPVALDVIAIDDTLVWANTHGIFSYDGRNIKELTFPIRSSLAPFLSSSLTSFKADFEKRRVVALNSTATKCVVDISGEKPMLYDYSTAGFRFTSKTLVAADSAPLMIDKIGITYTASASANMSLDVKINQTWKSESEFTIRPATDNGFAEIPLTNFLACRKFAMRITAMSSSLYINSIAVHLKQGGVRSYNNQ